MKNLDGVVNTVLLICPKIVSRYIKQITNNKINGETLTVKNANRLKTIVLYKISIITAPINAQHTNKIIPPFNNVSISAEASCFSNIGFTVIKKSKGASPKIALPINQKNAAIKYPRFDLLIIIKVIY